MNEVVIFCESYPQIKNTLYLAGRNYPDHSVTIVTTEMNNLHEFFNLVNERVFQGGLNVVHFDSYQGRTAKTGSRILKALYLVPDIIRERGYLKSVFNKHFAQLKKAEVFFFSRCFNPSTFHLLKTLDKTNRLVYMPDPTYDVLSIDKTAPENLAELVYLLKCKLVYGYDISLGKHPLGQRILCMPDKFLRERVGRIISREERDNLLHDFDISQYTVFDSTNYNAIYFHDDLRVLTGYDYIADAKAFERRLTEVFNIMGKYFPEDKVALKYHPGSDSSQGTATLPFGKRLPDFIPAEFLYNDKIKMYLGISSMALANVEKGLAVSLIDLIDFKNDTIRERLKEYLIEWSRSEVLFPRSLDEFEKILVGIKQEHREDS